MSFYVLKSISHHTVPENIIEHVHHRDIIHETDLVFSQNTKRQELRVVPHELDRPEHLWSLSLKLPQKSNSTANVTGREFGFVPADHIKHLVLGGAHLQLVQDLVPGHGPAVKQPAGADPKGPEPEHDGGQPQSGCSPHIRQMYSVLKKQPEVMLLDVGGQMHL